MVLGLAFFVVVLLRTFCILAFRCAPMLSPWVRTDHNAQREKCIDTSGTSERAGSMETT